MAYAVLTRKIDPHSAYTTVLVESGLKPVAMPVTRTEPPGDPGALGRALDAGGHAAIIIASARAAEALAHAIAHRATRAPLPLPEVWAVGPATSHALASAGIHAVHPPGAHDGATLARALLAQRSLGGRRVLVPRAEHGRDEAIQILRAAGAEIDDVVAYRTMPAPADDPAISEGRALLVGGEAAVCLVFAPSQVAALIGIVGPLPALRTRFLAIGDTTAAVLREAGVAEVEVATAPTPEGVANAVAAVYPPRP